MVAVDEKLAFAPAYEVAELIANKQVSPVEITELFFSRIERLDSQLHSYLLLTHDQAMASAKAAEEAVVRGDKLGPLHGVPISIKDLQMTKGVRTTGGSLAYKDRVPDADAAATELVRAAGAIMLGKTNTPEFGLLGTSENRHRMRRLAIAALAPSCDAIVSLHLDEHPGAPARINNEGLDIGYFHASPFRKGYHSRHD